ncbi:hypothetical protein JZ751_003932 [Albula glossodonta]|uniref:Uncharacterized protein n=1 Tax=Albula glossodonta TaxID=121402 RepID=A0A8T2P5S7_9TELE|nr:hypothetical protein JZ751_003932 [Albula glossodonta]
MYQFPLICEVKKQSRELKMPCLTFPEDFNNNVHNASFTQPSKPAASLARCWVPGTELPSHLCHKCPVSLSFARGAPKVTLPVLWMLAGNGSTLHMVLEKAKKCNLCLVDDRKRRAVHQCISAARHHSVLGPEGQVFSQGQDRCCHSPPTATSAPAGVRVTTDFSCRKQGSPTPTIPVLLTGFGSFSRIWHCYY